jgi:hypothetical protein
MRTNLLTPAFLASCLAVSTALAASADDGVTVNPMSFGTVLDAGQVVKGSGNGGSNDGTFIQRTSVWMNQSIGVGSNLDIRAGVGGVFWYTSPNPPAGSGEPGRFLQLPKFGPGITRVDMEYRFGQSADPMFTLQAGYFPYKYNPDAKNLGEYLIRSGAYPGFVSTGGWNLISGGGVMIQGLRLNMSLLNGRLKTDFLLPMEQDLPPVNGDFSPTVIASFAAAKGIEVGAGAQCFHCVSVKPSWTSPKIKPSTDATIYGPGNGYVYENPAYVDSLPVTEIVGNNPRYLIDTTKFYTFQGVKLMARASFDPKAYIAMPMLGAQDLKVFGEVALLGVKNYPFYYEKAVERMPVMFGINLPTQVGDTKILDVLSFQMEYYGSKFPNTTRTLDGQRISLPVPAVYDANGDLKDDPNLYDPSGKSVTGDDWKWSVNATKEFVKGLRLITQVANDHMRLPNEWGTNSLAPATTQPKDWYYLVRLEMGI